MVFGSRKNYKGNGQLPVLNGTRKERVLRTVYDKGEGVIIYNAFIYVRIYMRICVYRCMFYRLVIFIQGKIVNDLKSELLVKVNT